MRAINFLKSIFGRNKIADIADDNRPVRFTPISGGKEGELNEYSDTWVFVSNWAQAELQSARERNDSMKHDAVQTAALRGRIDMLKGLLELPYPKDRSTRNTEQD